MHNTAQFHSNFDGNSSHRYDAGSNRLAFQTLESLHGGLLPAPAQVRMQPHHPRMQQSPRRQLQSFCSRHSSKHVSSNTASP